MTTVRRSARTKRQAQTVYDEAKKALEESEERSSVKSRNEDEDSDASSKEDPEENETESENEKEEGEEQSSEDDSSEDEEEFAPKKSKARAPPKKKFKAPAPKRVGLREGPKKKNTTRTRAVRGTGPTRGLQTALTSLARKALEDAEKPEHSLAAALLHSYKSDPTSSKRAQQPVQEENRTIYTTGLEQVARGVVETHKDDPNKAQATLLNLIFRSVGGSVETNLNSDEVILEDMDNEQWGKVVTDLVDEMRHTPADRVLFCADPEGAVHAAAVDSSRDPSKVVVTASSLGVREYRKIYEEFWYVFGRVALSEGVSYENADNVDGDDSSDSDRHRTRGFTSTARFHAEMIRDVIVRTLELVSVGQPDVRAAATVAALHMCHALLDETGVLNSKIDVATRQFSAAAGKKSQHAKLSRKAESLKHQLDSLKRTRADLEEVVSGPVLQGVFMHRYRDSNMHIRAVCITALSRMTLQRPDMFLMDKYLKYFGWMMHDKCDCVRVASVGGLLAPFKAVQENNGSKRSSSVSKIDLGLMQNVVSKFLKRIVECVNDISTPVQEKGMALLLALLRNGFLDDIDENDEEEHQFWNKINSRAVARDTSHLVRRDALYFIIEQLEPFDDDNEADQGDSTQDSQFSRDKKVTLAQSSEKLAGRRLVELANWVAHILMHISDGSEDVDVGLADFIIHSLRDMPEHRSLATSWSAMLKVIGDDAFAPIEDGNNDGDVGLRQRIQVQMLACAAGAEVADVADPDFMVSDIDADVVAASTTADTEVSERSKKKSRPRSTQSREGTAHEILSVALLKALPELLSKFKGDPAVLASLTKLPRYLLPSVFSLPQRKNDFVAVTKSLTDIFLESADDSVLQTTALSLTFLSSGDHARTRDGRLQLKRMTNNLRDRLVSLLDKESSANDRAGGKKRKSNTKHSPAKRRRSQRSSTSSQSSVETVSSSKEEDDEGVSDATDVEYAIYLCLKRLSALSKRCDIAKLLESSDPSSSNGIEGLCNVVVEGVANRLKERKSELLDSEDDSDENHIVVPAIWKECDEKVHSAVAKSANEALSFLLKITAWKLREALELEGLLVEGNYEAQTDSDADDDAQDHGVVRVRDQLIALLELCFEQHLPEAEEDGDEGGITPLYTAEQIEFADSVQIHAGKVAADLRMLFPREWEDAVNPLLRACALTEDIRLIGGFVRFFRSKEDKLRENENTEKEDVELVQSLLLPMGRGLASNWRQGNRREAGIALGHLTGSGQAASDAMGSLSRLMKKVDPVRLVEAHMACLRQSYDDWLEERPEELESDRPTDEEMAMYDEAERNHQEMFHALEQQAARLSMSLGVGKLSDPKLSPALLGFVKEGVRFAFSNTRTGGMADSEDDDLMLGIRLSFLHIVSRYVNWIKKNKEHLSVIREDVLARETELRAHEDFSEVYEDDLEAIAAFRASVGLKNSRNKESSPRSVFSAGDVDDEDGVGLGEATMTPSSMSTSSRLRGRLSRGSSVGSLKSKLSTQSELSPLYEEDAVRDGSDADDASPSPKKRKMTRHRSTSLGSTVSHSTLGGRTQTPIEEESGESFDERSG